MTRKWARRLSRTIMMKKKAKTTIMATTTLTTVKPKTEMMVVVAAAMMVRYALAVVLTNSDTDRLHIFKTEGTY